MIDIKPVTISHLVKYEDLNHHGTLFAGRMAEWMVEACFICAARAAGKPGDVVCVQIHGMSFVKPASRGDIITVEARMAAAGNKSITVYGQVTVNQQAQPYVTSFATFVTVDREGRPYPHGLALTPEYIEQNREIHEKAKALKK
jgi:acyl-CoA hydrolase